MFAIEELTQCPLWYSLRGTSVVLGQDALAHPWPRVLLYAFPPADLAYSTEGFRGGPQASALLWPAWPWFDLLSQLGGQI